MRLEKWNIQRKQFTDGFEMSGIVYGNPKFKDGSHIYTSHIVAINFVEQVVITKNSRYELGEPFNVTCAMVHPGRFCEEDSDACTQNNNNRA